MLKIFEECPQKFFLKYIEKVSLPQRSTIFEKGKKIHALANYYLNGENIEKMEKILTADEKFAWDALKSSEYFKLKVFNTEYNLSCRIDKYWIGGRLDALVFDGKNYFILDYKTGKIPQNAEQDFQTIVYLLCSDKFLNKKDGYNSLKFIYIGLKAPHPNLTSPENDTQSFSLGRVPQGGRENPQQKEILLTSDLKKQYEEKIIQTCKKIDLAIYSNIFSHSKERCHNCEYNKFCDD